MELRFAGEAWDCGRAGLCGRRCGRRIRTRRVGADRHRPRLGPRRRPEPVGRLRLRAPRLEVPPDPRALLPGHEDEQRRRPPRARPAHAGGRVRHRGLRDADGRDRRQAADAEASRRDVRRRAAARPPGAASRGRALLRAPRRLRLPPRAARVRRARVPRDARPPQPGQEASPSSTASPSTRTSAVSSRPSRRRTGRSPRSRRRRSRPARTPLAELRPSSWYDLVPTTADQVYGGVRAERPRSDHAVYATRGQVLTWDGQVARTYYSSSSGGRTVAVQDAWHGSAPIPYLRSVPDPYDTLLPAPRLGPVQLLVDAAGRAAGSRERDRVGAGAAGQQPARRVGRLPPGVGCGRPAQRRRRGAVAASAVDLVLDRAAAALGEQQPCAVREPHHARRARGERAGRSAAAADSDRRVAWPSGGSGVRRGSPSSRARARRSASSRPARTARRYPWL